MKIKARAFAQITLDDDYIVRDNKPDVIRVIYTHGDILLEDTKVGNKSVWITGKLRFHTLYQSDDENRRLESVSGEIPFQEKLLMDELEDKDEVSVDVQIEDCLLESLIHESWWFARYWICLRRAWWSQSMNKALWFLMRKTMSKKQF